MNTSDATRELVQILSNYTSQIVNQSMMTTMRELSKKAYQKRDTEFNNSRRFHARFAPLAEHQANLKEQTRRDFQNADKKFQDGIAANARTIETIAFTIPNSNAAVASGNEGLRRLEQRIDEKAWNLNASFEKLEGKTADFLQNSTDAIANIKKEMSAKSPPQPTVPADIKTRIDNLNDRVNEFPNLRLEITKHKEELAKIRSLVNDRAKEVADVKQAIVGENGVEQSVANVEEIMVKHRNLFQQADKGMSRLDNEVNVLNKRVADLESKSIAKAEAVPATDDVDPGSSADLHTKVEHILSDLEHFRTVQEQRDDLVSDEIEKSRMAVMDLSGLVTGLRKTIDDKIAEVNAELSKQEGSIVTLQSRPQPQTQATTVSGWVRPAQQANGTDQLSHNVGKLSAEIIKQRNEIQGLRSSANTMSQVVQQIDTRLNNLTTGHVVQAMVGQMQAMYPSIGQVISELNVANNTINQVGLRVDELAKRLDQHTSQPSGPGEEARVLSK
jgi:hypothetical protein